MGFTTSVAKVLGLAAVAKAHMRMNTPVPFANPSGGNGPLDASGSNFPCMNSGGVLQVNKNNNMELGSTQPLKFTGQAVHGGGSCQVSITYDTQPTKDSIWKVIHTIEGGCPAVNTAGNAGNDANAEDPDVYSFTVPSNIPAGNGTLAWTWFNKIGNREMYMNCAPITLSGQGGDQSAYSALPDMFVANIGNGCGTAEGTDVVFPNAGDSVERKNGATEAFADPTGNCGAVATRAPGSGSGDAAGATPTPTPGSGSPAAAPNGPPYPIATPAPLFGTGRPSGPGSFKSAPGGVFMTVPIAGTPPSVTPAPEAPAEPVIPTPPKEGGDGSNNDGSPSETEGVVVGAEDAGSACSPEGLWNCVDGSSFQHCGSGIWTPVMSLASGMGCTPGESSIIEMADKGHIKRFSVRFRG